MAFLVRTGERVRLEISNADNPMTDGMLFHWCGFTVGIYTYHQGGAHPSRLVLPGRPPAGAA